MDISVVYNKLIALNCLEAPEKQTVQNLWGRRFSGRNAFWVDVQPGMTDEDLRQAILAVLAPILRNIAGQSIVITTFRDLTKVLDDATQQLLSRVPQQLGNLLNCNISLVYDFAYLGSLAPQQRPDLRSRITTLSQLNARQVNLRRQLCLVAHPPSVDSQLHWKAAVVFLDLLRRSHSPADLLPVLPAAGDKFPNDDVGFLRYGELDAQGRVRLEARREQLQKFLSLGNVQPFRDGVHGLVRQLEQAVNETIQFDPAAQPLHPDLMVKGFFATWKAKRGKHKKYENAARLTREAIAVTGNGVSLQVKRLVAHTAGDPKALLQQLLQDAQVGVRLLQQDRGSLKKALSFDLGTSTIPTSPGLRYQKHGHLEDIRQYLADMKAHGLYQAKKLLQEQLLEALDAIRVEDVHRQAAQYQQELEKLQEALQETTTEKVFCQDVQHSGSHLDSRFYPKNPKNVGATKKFLICEDQASCQKLKEYETPDLSLYSILGRGAGLMEEDGLPIKALHVLSFDYSDTLLEDLIPEV